MGDTEQPPPPAPELVDPLQKLREKCRKNHQDLVDKLDQCTERVSCREQTTETCTEELFDLLSAVDKCVAKDLFKKLQ
ncbi:cytochrome b-c1 complex subunit 6, mitochondrial-like isoform X1 [Onthophagus taurus]|uniref:cytochrome b-c1 complex subunit 6, mitochondrial-like isoform X1 n=1 Tax=Onthophagus taurus TaxID=166361 RepID=UPI000C203238|nr:cytochrome b-c1 complex subunit 6, mitochondrial-like [Onthophagus taurus]XP_022908523.1 cytochrome b-c1 complex subunit 6, mitochondrial-like isoform X1 [Onthophagus taurus]